MECSIAAILGSSCSKQSAYAQLCVHKQASAINCRPGCTAISDSNVDLSGVSANGINICGLSSHHTFNGCAGNTIMQFSVAFKIFDRALVGVKCPGQGSEFLLWNWQIIQDLFFRQF